MQTKSTLNIEVKEIPNFDDEDSERADIEKHPTKKGDLDRRPKRDKPHFDIDGDRIDEFQEDFEDSAGLKTPAEQSEKLGVGRPVRNPKNSKLELKQGMGKQGLNTFKLSNASDKYRKQKTYKSRGKRPRRRGHVRTGEAPSRHVLEKNPFMLGKRRPMNEKNFCSYLEGIPSRKKGAGEFKTLRKLEKENLQLNEDLRDLNDKLSEMIGKKGYENLLEQLKGAKQTFVERPVSRQVRILRGELHNGDKTVAILRKERARVDKMLEKVVSPVTFSEIMRSINNKKREIKELKNENFGLVMENKKVGKMLEKGGWGDRGILKKLLMQYNTVRAKNKETESEIERLENVRQELEAKRGGLDEKEAQVRHRLREAGLENWDPGVEKRVEKARKGLQKEEHRRRVLEKNFRVKESELKRLERKREAALKEARGELQKKKGELETLRRDAEEARKQKEKVEKGAETQETDRMVTNLKKFQTENGKKSEDQRMKPGKSQLYSTKTDHESGSQQFDKADSDRKEETVVSEENDEVAKLLKQSDEKADQVRPMEAVAGGEDAAGPDEAKPEPEKEQTEKPTETQASPEETKTEGQSDKGAKAEEPKEKEKEEKAQMDDLDALLGKGSSGGGGQSGEPEKPNEDNDQISDDDFDFMD